jgi:endonuclease/exonuclease/phosphatase family metal-dependent hydrolase
VARVPVRDVAVHPLGQLHRDAARRAAVSCSVGLAGGDLRVVGTHMSHLTHRSPVQFRRLRACLPPITVPAALAGDMNLWGPPVLGFFPGWRRAVVGRSWPEDRPHSQLDHVLVTPPVTVDAAAIAPVPGSDHRPAVVRLRIG